MHFGTILVECRNWKLHTNSFKIQKLIQYDENFGNNSLLTLFVHTQSDVARGQVHRCHKLIVNLFKKGSSPCKQEFFEIGIKRQILDHYLKGIIKTTSYYGLFTNEILPPKSNQKIHQIQTNDIDVEFSKVFTVYVKKKYCTKFHKEQTRYSQMKFFPLFVALYLWKNEGNTN